MICIVLGMHKSGTTLVSQILHESNIDMGDGFDAAVSYDTHASSSSKWERHEAFLNNLDLVGADQETYLSIDYYLPHLGPTPERIRSNMSAMVEACESRGGDWGFKEPLTCLTYSAWAPLLGQHKVVGIYRDPTEVINHYGARWRHPRLAWRVIRAWTSYNQGVLDAVEGAGEEGILIRYDALMSGDDEFRRLESFLGRSLNDMRKPGRYRARAQHQLYGPIDYLMRATSENGPSKVLDGLEAARRRQIDGGSIGERGYSTA